MARLDAHTSLDAEATESVPAAGGGGRPDTQPGPWSTPSPQMSAGGSPGRARVVARGVVVALLAGAAFVVLYVGAVRTPRGQGVDELLRGAGRGGGESALLALVSVPGIVVACLAVVVVAAVRRRWAAGGAALALVALANVGAQLLKNTVLERPDFVGWPGNSLPSGHATVWASVLVALLLVLPLGLRLLATVPASALVLLVGLDLVRLGWHRPSDVVAALLLVLCLTALLTLVPGVVEPGEGVDAGVAAAGGVLAGGLVLLGLLAGGAALAGLVVGAPATLVLHAGLAGATAATVGLQLVVTAPGRACVAARWVSADSGR